MTNKEAIKRIQDIITYTGLTIPTSLNDIEALEMAIKALEEERPQDKWIMEEKPFGGFGDNVLTITCSICKTSYVYRGKTYNYCPNCGSKMEIKNENI